MPAGTVVRLTIEASPPGHDPVVKQILLPAGASAAVLTQREAARPVLLQRLAQSVRAGWRRVNRAAFWSGAVEGLLAKWPILGNSLLLCGGGVALAAAAQAELSREHAYSPAAGRLLGLTLLVFGWACIVMRVSKRWPGESRAPEISFKGWFVADRRKRWISCGLVGFALVASFWTLQDLNRLPPLPTYMDSLLRWGLAGAAVVGAAWLIQAPAPASPARAPEALRKRWSLAARVALIVVVAFALRAWRVAEIPQTLGGDEGEQGVETLRVLSGDLRNPFVTGWYSVATLSFYFNAITVDLFGGTILGLRLAWVMVGTLSVLVTFLLVRQLQGPRLALITAALVATYHYHIHYSRLGSNQIADTLIVGLALLFLYRGYDRRSWLDWALCGVVIGLGQYFYAGARLAVLLVAALAAYLFLRDRFRFDRRTWVGIGALVLAALVVGGPMLRLAVLYPEEYAARLNQVGILRNGWLQSEAQLLNQSVTQILTSQFWRGTLAFNAYPDRTGWYGLRGPLLEEVPGILFMLGLLGTTVLSMRDRRLAPMTVWWWSAVIGGGTLTDTAPSSQRLITAAIPAMFCVAWTIDVLAGLIARQLRLRLAAVTLNALTVLALSGTSLSLYFHDYTPQRIYGGPHAMIGTLLSRYVTERLGPDWNIYFFGAPRMYVNIGTIRYLLPHNVGVDISEPLQAPLGPEVVVLEKEALFVFLPERVGEFEWVQRSFPGGETGMVNSPVQPERILYLYYRVSDPAAAWQAGVRGAAAAPALDAAGLTSQLVFLDGTPVWAHFTPVDIGQLSDAFDDNAETLMRGQRDNPFVIELEFFQPRPSTRLALTLGSMDRFNVAVQLTYADGRTGNVLNHYANLPSDPTVEILLPQSPASVRSLHIAIEDEDPAPVEGYHIHVREITLN